MNPLYPNKGSPQSSVVNMAQTFTGKFYNANGVRPNAKSNMSVNNQNQAITENSTSANSKPGLDSNNSSKLKTGYFTKANSSSIPQTQNILSNGPP